MSHQVLLIIVSVLTVVSGLAIGSAIYFALPSLKSKETLARDQKLTIDCIVENYKQESLNKTRAHALDCEYQVWVEVQHARKKSYEEIAQINIDVEKARNQLNVIKSEQRQNEIIMKLKDQEIERLYNILKTAKG